MFGDACCRNGDVKLEVVEYDLSVVFVLIEYVFHAFSHDCESLSVWCIVVQCGKRCDVHVVGHGYGLAVSAEAIGFGVVAVCSKFAYAFVAALLVE